MKIPSPTALKLILPIYKKCTENDYDKGLHEEHEVQKIADIVPDERGKVGYGKSKVPHGGQNKSTPKKNTLEQNNNNVSPEDSVLVASKRAKQQQALDQQLEVMADHICQTQAQTKLQCVKEDGQGRVRSKQSPQGGMEEGARNSPVTEKCQFRSCFRGFKPMTQMVLSKKHPKLPLSKQDHVGKVFQALQSPMLPSTTASSTATGSAQQSEATCNIEMTTSDDKSCESTAPGLSPQPHTAQEFLTQHFP